MAFLAKDEKEENGVERAAADDNEGPGKGGGVPACSDQRKEKAAQHNFDTDTGKMKGPLSVG